MAYIISSGEVSSGINLSYDSMTVLNGGIVYDTEVNYLGRLFISSGGTANSTTTVYLSSFIFISNSGTANSTTVNSGGHVTISGGIANNTTINSRGWLSISSGGTANQTTVNAGGSIFILSGGTATDIVWTPCEGHVYVSEGGYATFVSEYSGVYYGSGNQLLSNVAVLNDKTIDSLCEMYVMNGGTATSTTVIFNGYLYVTDGGTADSTMINEYSSMFVSSGGTANSTTINNNGVMSVSSCGTANNTIIPDGRMNIFNGGMANNTTVNSGGGISVSNGGIANQVTLNSGGYIYISSDGIANGVTINSLCQTIVRGTANKTAVNSGGYMTISSGGIAKDVLENGGYVNVAKEADVTFVSNTLSCLDIRNDSATIHSGTTANSTTINSRGYMSIFSSGIASNTTIYGSGVLSISSGGITKDVKTYAGGTLKIANGGNITGKMSFLAGAVVSVEDGAIIDFDLSQTMTNDKALLSDWSLIQGTPDYTLTVNEKQDTGIYTLADAADDFDGTITVQNTVGESLGTLVLGQTTKIGDADYTLTVADSSLTVTIGTIEPVIPSSPTGLRAFIDGQDVALVWNASTDDTSGIKEYVVTYSLDGQDFTVRTINTNYVLKDTDFGSYSWTVQAVDFAGNESAVTAGEAFTMSGFKPYTVEYSADNFEHIITFAVTTPSLDAFRMPGGTYQMRVKQEDSGEWLTGDPIVSEETGDAPQLVKSDADGNADVFFANAVGTWESGYVAQHVGSINDWGGTNEYAGLYGKNKLADIIEGSDDANILLMSDDENGDSLFVDDIYTDLPGSIAEQQARIARINEIRAGAGDDIVDMTSQRFEYIGDGLTIHGGAGNDVIWANKGDNFLFGDAGNDRIVGASGNDVIAGGIGNDRLHGGGGEDVFTFCDNWGVDNVEQLAGASVTLWFVSGSEDKWNASTLTYTDGDNSVTVKGVTPEQITLKFGDDGTDQFAMLSGMGAFFDATTERIFEESGKGILASL